MKFEPGTCYLCNKKCDEESFCHYECAVSRADYLEKLAEKNRDRIGVPKKEWKK